MLKIKLVIINEALRNAYKRGDMDSMRAMFTNASDTVLKKIGEGELELRGDSDSSIELYSVDRVYIWPTPFKGARRVDGRVDVTGKSDRAIDRVMRGMQINLNSEEYYLAKVVVPGEVYEEK